ncbi:MAG TPA: diaminopimelate epimerase [Actinomycetota bacterium]|jgi:diaminopimelate epimerase|nr:diaminopimelate epimerase [Actinomycetota bacterium]
MKFAKYQGIGNDFVMIADPADEIRLDPEQVRALCDRRFGIGGDGVIRLRAASSDADFFMDYSNSDGSVGEMCGNGIRCLAAFARDEGLTDATTLRIDTRAGLKIVEVQDGGRSRVNMGAPIFQPDEIPVRGEGSDALHTKLELEHGVLEAASLSMGNPHAVLFVEDLDGTPVTSLGGLIEHHPAFPNGVNVEFVHVSSPERVDMRVWERGSGATLACGTGACAGAVAARLLRNTNRRVTVGLPGGELDVEWDGSLDEVASVFMTGPAARSFYGEIEI